MTDEPKKPEEEISNAAESAEAENAKPEETKSPGEALAAAAPATEKKPDSDPLPETEERSAEFVEEEAVRGDFVLRWAIVLLAMMFAFTQTDDSRALMHAKSGEYMQSNGFLPPRVDVFSASAEGQPWIQLSWLFDHVAAFLTALPDSVGFTLLTSLLAGLAFGYAVHTALPNVSTWWTTICMAFALMACYPRFTPTPELITLAFTAITLGWLYKWQTSDLAVRRSARLTELLDRVYRNSLPAWIVRTTYDLLKLHRIPWRIVALFALWANLDPHVWVGLLVIVLYAAGHLVDRALGRIGWTLTGSGHTRALLQLVVLCGLASLANPFFHESLLQPLRQYTVEYPAMQEYRQLSERADVPLLESTAKYYGLLQPEIWTARHKSTIAGAIIILISLTFFIVNLKHMDTGYLLVLLGVTALAALATHELAVAALVAAVLAGLNGQDWFRHNFRNEYTTDTKTFVFSQGGRALTVIGLFFFAFLGVSGRLTGPQGLRIGYGLDPNLKAAVDGMGTDLEGIDADAHIFNFTPEQGDLLINAGYKPFIDSRIGLFADRGSKLLDTHLSTRAALRFKSRNVLQTEKRDDPTVWQKTLKDHKITHVTPRLYVSPGTGLPADYGTYQDLLRTGKWSLEKLGSAAAVFTPAKPGTLADSIRLVDLGLDIRTKDVPKRLDWARGPSFYDQYLFVPKKVYRADSQMAQHYSRQMTMLYQGYEGIRQQAIRTNNQQLAQQSVTVLPDLTGACYLTIQSANKALSIDGEDAIAYRAIGDAETTLNNSVEQGLVGSLRFRLAMAAYRQSLKADPNQSDLYLKLSRIYRESRRSELSVEMLSKYLDLVDTGDSVSEQDSQQLEEQYKLRNQLRERNEKTIENVVEMRTKMKEQEELNSASETPTPEDNLRRAEELVRFCTGIWEDAGLTKHALRTLEDEPEVVQGFPPALLLWGRLLLENGDYEEANTAFLQLEQLSKQKNNPVGKLQWESEAAVAAMIGADYERARDLWQRQYKQLENSTRDFAANQKKLSLLPFLGSMQDWPEKQTGGPRGDAGLSSLLVQIPSQIAAVRFQIALSFFEEGNGQRGSALMRQLVDKSPTSQISQLARFYYSLVNKENLNYTWDAGYIPIDLNAPLPSDQADDAAKAAQGGEEGAATNGDDPAKENASNDPKPDKKADANDGAADQDDGDNGAADQDGDKKEKDNQAE